jgi:hypothetical protein
MITNLLELSMKGANLKEALENLNIKDFNHFCIIAKKFKNKKTITTQFFITFQYYEVRLNNIFQTSIFLLKLLVWTKINM